MNEVHQFEIDAFEDRSDRMSEEARHRLEMDRHAQEMISLLERIHAKQQEWEENQRWQINDMREHLKKIDRGISWWGGVLSVIAGFIAYKMA